MNAKNLILAISLAALIVFCFELGFYQKGYENGYKEGQYSIAGRNLILNCSFIHAPKVFLPKSLYRWTIAYCNFMHGVEFVFVDKKGKKTPIGIHSKIF